MGISKKEVVDLIEVIESGVVQVRIDIRIVENGTIISSSYHRHAIAPGQDYSGESERVRAVCAAVHTPKVIADYVANLENSAP